MRALLATAAILSIATSAAAGSPDRPDLRAAAAERKPDPRLPAWRRLVVHDGCDGLVHGDPLSRCPGQPL